MLDCGVPFHHRTHFVPFCSLIVRNLLSLASCLTLTESGLSLGNQRPFPGVIRSPLSLEGRRTILGSHGNSSSCLAARCLLWTFESLDKLLWLLEGSSYLFLGPPAILCLPPMLHVCLVVHSYWAHLTSQYLCQTKVNMASQSLIPLVTGAS